MQRVRVEIEVYSIWISLHIYEEDILVLERTVQNKIALYFFKYQATKRNGGIVNIAPSILKIGTRWIEFCFKPQPLYPRKKQSPLDFEFETG